MSEGGKLGQKEVGVEILAVQLCHCLELVCSVNPFGTLQEKVLHLRVYGVALLIKPGLDGGLGTVKHFIIQLPIVAFRGAGVVCWLISTFIPLWTFAFAR